MNDAKTINLNNREKTVLPDTDKKDLQPIIATISCGDEGAIFIADQFLWCQNPNLFLSVSRIEKIDEDTYRGEIVPASFQHPLIDPRIQEHEYNTFIEAGFNLYDKINFKRHDVFWRDEWLKKIESRLSKS